MFERANIATGPSAAADDGVRTIAKKHGMECLFHEKPFAGSTDPVSTSTSPGNAQFGSLLVPGDTRMRTPSSWCSARRSSAPCTSSAGLLRVRWPRPPTTTAWVPTRLRRPSSRSSSANSWPTCSSRSPRARRRRQRARASCTHRRRHPADPADRPGRPKPHQPVRLHRQPLRVPRPGSGQTVAVPMIIINTIMADSFDYIASVLEKAVGGGETSIPRCRRC